MCRNLYDNQGFGTQAERLTLNSASHRTLQIAAGAFETFGAFETYELEVRFAGLRVLF